MTTRSGLLTPTRLLTAFLAAAILLGSCRSVPEPSDDGPQLPAPAPGEDFYFPGEVPEAEPGRLIRALKLEVVPGVLGWRVLYHSTALDGRDIVVSGLVFALEEPAEPRSRPVVAWGHGSAGLGDSCAPSRSPNALIGQPLFFDILSRGFVITATDYEGLGTDGPHPWLVGLSEGRGVIDSVRAAQEIPETAAGNRFVAFGASQGGGAVMFAGELVESYGKGLELLGVIAAAPAAELDLVALRPELDVAGLSEFVVMGAFGFKAAYPELDLEAILKPEIIAQKDQVERLCQDEISSRFRNTPLNEVLKAAPAEVEGWPEAIEENTPGRKRIPAPVLLLHGSADLVVPAEVSRVVFDRLCQLDTQVQRLVYPGIDHFRVLHAGAQDILQFLERRAAGRAISERAGAATCT